MCIGFIAFSITLLNATRAATEAALSLPELFILLDAETDAVWPRANGAGRESLASQLVEIPEEIDTFILPAAGDVLCEPVSLARLESR